MYTEVVSLITKMEIAPMYRIIPSVIIIPVNHKEKSMHISKRKVIAGIALRTNVDIGLDDGDVSPFFIPGICD